MKVAYSLPTSSDNLAAERLAALLDAERENTALREDNARLRETLDRMEHFRSSAETALAMAEERERAAVVAWLFRLFPDNAMFSFMLNGVARQIVCGEHHCENTRDP